MKYLQSNKRETAMTTLKKSTKQTLSKMPMLKSTTMRGLGGSFRDYQLNRYWDNFNFGLYNRICEIKMQEL
jgi:hypothetical protein